MASLGEQELGLLKAFVAGCKSNPSLLHQPELDFFKDYLESLGGTVPPPAAPKAEESSSGHGHSHGGGHGHSHDGEECHGHGQPEPAVVEEEEEEEDFDTPTPEVEHTKLEIPGTEGLEAEDTSSLEMGDGKAAPSDDDAGAASEHASKGREALSNRDFPAAIAAFSDAIKLDATGTRAFALRAKAHIKSKQPHAAIKDSDAVLERNPDSAAGFKWRGKANAMLGNWVAAYEDLSKAQSIDFDDETFDWLPEIKKNATKLKEDARTYDRLVAEREKLERVRRQKKAKRDYDRSASSTSSASSSSAGGFPGGMGGMGGMGGGMPGGMPAGMAGLMQDPEMLAAMQDPDIMAAIMDMQGNPANLMKHMSNPKVAAFIQKMQGKMGGGMGGGMPGGMGGGMPGGFPGGMGGGMPGGMPDFGASAEPAPEAAAPPPSMDDID